MFHNKSKKCKLNALIATTKNYICTDKLFKKIHSFISVGFNFLKKETDPA